MTTAQRVTQEWYSEFYRRAKGFMIAAEGHEPSPEEIKQHGQITIDPDGTRRFIWRGEEKFHMRIDVNWREDGR